MIVEDFQINQCRGIEPMVLATSFEIFSIKAPATRVSEAITQLNPIALIHAEAIGRVIRASKRGIVLLQLRGFDWTIMYEHRTALSSDRVELSQLSDMLQTRVMTLTVTDTAPYIYQQVWDKGKSVEHIDFRDDHFVKLESQIREVNEACIDDDSLNYFYSEQGVYIPDLQITSESIEDNSKSLFMFKVSGEFSGCLRKQFENMSSEERFKDYQLERDDFERFDYITFEE